MVGTEGAQAAQRGTDLHIRRRPLQRGPHAAEVRQPTAQRVTGAHHLAWHLPTCDAMCNSDSAHMLVLSFRVIDRRVTVSP